MSAKHSSTWRNGNAAHARLPRTGFSRFQGDAATDMAMGRHLHLIEGARGSVDHYMSGQAQHQRLYMAEGRRQRVRDRIAAPLGGTRYDNEETWRNHTNLIRRARHGRAATDCWQAAGVMEHKAYKASMRSQRVVRNMIVQIPKKTKGKPGFTLTEQQVIAQMSNHDLIVRRAKSSTDSSMPEGLRRAQEVRRRNASRPKARKTWRLPAVSSYEDKVQQRRGGGPRRRRSRDEREQEQYNDTRRANSSLAILEGGASRMRDSRRLYPVDAVEEGGSAEEYDEDYGDDFEDDDESAAPPRAKSALDGLLPEPGRKKAQPAVRAAQGGRAKGKSSSSKKTKPERSARKGRSGGGGGKKKDAAIGSDHPLAGLVAELERPRSRNSSTYSGDTAPSSDMPSREGSPAKPTTAELEAEVMAQAAGEVTAYEEDEKHTAAAFLESPQKGGVFSTLSRENSPEENYGDDDFEDEENAAE